MKSFLSLNLFTRGVLSMFIKVCRIFLLFCSLSRKIGEYGFLKRVDTYLHA